MRRLPIFRALLVALFAVFSGPQSLAAGGVVVCGAPGGAAYDFEIGAPKTPEPAFATCGECLFRPVAAPALSLAPRSAPLGAAGSAVPRGLTLQFGQSRDPPARAA